MNILDIILLLIMNNNNRFIVLDDRHRIPIQKLFNDKFVVGLGGEDQVNYQTVPMEMIIKDHSEVIQFYVSHLPANVPLILGKEWLRKHDPTISFKDQTVKFNSKYCKENCCSSSKEIEERIKDNKKKEAEDKEKKVELAKEIVNNYGKNDKATKINEEKNKSEKDSDSNSNCKIIKEIDYNNTKLRK